MEDLEQSGDSGWVLVRREIDVLREEDVHSLSGYLVAWEELGASAAVEVLGWEEVVEEASHHWADHTE